MSQDFVNDLPTELLFQVFKYLNYVERTTAADVCTRWFDILSSEKYRKHLKLDYDCLEAQLDDAKRHRSIIIEFRPTYDEIPALQRIFNDKEVMGNLEELHVNLGEVEWQDLFKYETEECYFPKLRSLTLVCCDEDFFCTPFPHSKQTVPTPKWILSDKIEILEILYTPTIILPKAELFPNLRSLTLDNIDEFIYEDCFELITKNLKELKIISIDSLSLELIFHNAHNLESLSIFGDLPISAEAYEAINNMKKLKQLTFTSPITGTATGLSLPFLEKLKVFADRLTPLDNVPNLWSLGILDHTFGNEATNCKKTFRYYRLFGHQLHHLSLEDLNLDKEYISEICTLSNLQIVRVSSSNLEFIDVENICQSIGNLKLLRLECCTIVRKILITAENRSSDYECEDCTETSRNEYEMCENMKAWFSNLRSLYVDCAIETTHCKSKCCDFVFEMLLVLRPYIDQILNL